MYTKLTCDWALLLQLDYSLGRGAAVPAGDVVTCLTVPAFPAAVALSGPCVREAASGAVTAEPPARSRLQSARIRITW